MHFKSIVLGILISVAGSVSTYAQTPLQCTPPDYDQIREQVSNNLEQYELMLARFMDADSTLTTNDVYTLYYGYPYSGKYNPFFTLDELEKAISEDFIPKAEAMYRDATKGQQMSLGALYYLYIIHKNSKDSADQAKCDDDLWRISKVMDVILSTGNGDKESPMYVIFVLDEYAALGIMEYPSPNSQRLVGNCDVLTVDVEAADGLGIATETTEIYFNIAPSLSFIASAAQ